MPVWTDRAKEDAAELVRQFADDIVQSYVANDCMAACSLYKYPRIERYHQENEGFASFDLVESAAILTELAEHRETDAGLWEGLDPIKALSVMANRTYSNAIAHEFRALLYRINNDQELTDMGMAYIDDDNANSVIAVREDMWQRILKLAD